MLCVTWTRRNRRLVTEPRKWDPTMKNPLKGLVVWTVPENKEASITLFGDPRSHDFEDKMWTFFVEDVSTLTVKYVVYESRFLITFTLYRFQVQGNVDNWLVLV